MNAMLIGCARGNQMTLVGTPSLVWRIGVEL